MHWQYFLIAFISFGVCRGQDITIGALFDDKTGQLTDVFKYAVESVNKQYMEDEGTIDGRIMNVPYGNELIVSKKLCKLLKSKVAVIIGPSAPSSAHHAQSVCDNKEMPYIDTRFDFPSSQPVINMHPDPNSLAKFYLDMVTTWSWKKFTVLYENSFWLPSLSEVLKSHSKDSKGSVTIRKLDLGLNGNYRKILTRVKIDNDLNIIIHCSITILPEVLKQAQQVGLLTDRHHIFITSLDLHTFDLEPYQHSGTNITGIRLVNPDNVMVSSITKEIVKLRENNEEEQNEGNGDESNDDDEETEDENGDHGHYKGNDNGDEKDNEDENEDEDGAEDETEDGEENGDHNGDDSNEKNELNPILPYPLTVEAALTYDAVLLFRTAIDDIRSKGFEMNKLSCNSEDTWKHGYTIINYMKTTTVHGLTGQIKFDTHGVRSEFAVDVIELAASGINKIGSWNSSEGLTISRANIKPQTENVAESDYFKNKTFLVLTALTPPYGMLKKSPIKLEGNQRFEGFGIELIHELSLRLGFNYTFELQPDNVYGSLNKETGEWNGMIKEIMEDRADLAITDLTITADRESAVDFTMPFMNLGISILYRTPKKEPPSLFSFMSPFSNEVWLYLGGGFLLVAVTLFVLGRISPDEWDNPYPCIEEPEFLENQFRFANCMWFAAGALLQQGTEIAPKSPSTRTVASIWWFFTLIMVSSYTANLAAFLTVESNSSPIDNAEDLANANGAIKYGAKRDGSTINFFKEAEYPTYAKMYKYMMDHSDLLTSNNAEGQERARSENYAYLMESTSIEYIVERDCELTQIGSLLDDKGYGIAMKKNSKYRSAMSTAVLKLQEEGKLTDMKRKWWKEKHGGGKCTVKADGGAEELGMANVGGVFFVVIVGSFFASLYGMFNFTNSIRRRAHKYSVSFKDELKAEVKFVLACHGNVKPVRHRGCKSRSTTASFDSQESIEHQKDNSHNGRP